MGQRPPTTFQSQIEILERSTAAVGAQLEMYHDSPTPADDDVIARTHYYGRNDAGEKIGFAKLDVVATDVSDGSEDADLIFYRMVAGTLTQFLKLSDRITITNEAMSENTKVVYLEAATSDTTHGVRQGALHIELYRNADDALTSWDGNPDCAIKVVARNYAANTAARGRVRGMDLNVRNRTAGTCAGLNGLYITAENSANTIGESIVAQFNMKNSGVISGDNIGLFIQDQSQGTTTGGTVYGLKISTSAYSPGGGRAGAIYINSTGGSWVNGIMLDGTITNVLDFAESDGTNGATLKAGSYSTGGNEVKLKIDVASTTYYLIGYATAT